MTHYFNIFTKKKIFLETAYTYKMVSSNFTFWYSMIKLLYISWTTGTMLKNIIKEYFVPKSKNILYSIFLQHWAIVTI